MTENLHCSLDGSGPESLSRSRSELASKGSNGELVSLGKGGAASARSDCLCSRPASNMKARVVTRRLGSR